MADPIVMPTPPSNLLSRPARLLRRALGPITAGLGSAQRFAHAMATLRGGITPAEGRALAAAAASVRRGIIVEIGSYRGKSAVALAHGVRGRDVPIWCVDPHEEFVGALGGTFGPQDRAEFFRTMLSTRAYEQVRLVNLPAAQLAEAWHDPIGMLFIDGDHRYDAVRSDFDRWYPHVVAGGVIALDDTHVEELGPAQLLRELLPSRSLRVLHRTGKITFLQKLEHLTPRPRATRRFLVVCHELHAAGGLMRFHRVAEELRTSGDSLSFVALGDSRVHGFATDCPVLSLAEASALHWDVTMVPGQGFPKETIRGLSHFRQRRFGRRIQHVLNDRSLRDGFLAVNESFGPDVVVFNNRDWSPGSFVDFAADRFEVLEGAVDAARFDVSRRPHDGFVVGGVCKPSLTEFWLDFAQAMPADWRLRLFGVELGIEHPRVEHVGKLEDSALPRFFAGLDAVVHAESKAGWANVVAEAMAASVPVVCSTKGTAAIARAGATARVVDDEELAEGPAPFVRELIRLRQDPAETAAMAQRAREQIRRFDWKSYTGKLRALTIDDGRSHYTADSARGLLGKWPVTERLAGLSAVLDSVRGRSVLDLGCAEGVIARACLDHGAVAIHGFELDASRIATCRQLNPEPLAHFLPGSVSPWSELIQQTPTLRAAYDVVLHLGLHHHLPVRERRAVLTGALERCREVFALRTPEAVWQSEKLDALIRSQGFALTHTENPAIASQGVLRVYRRERGSPLAVARDLRFVSFPKSGRTWMRFALDALGVTDEVTFEHDGFEYNDGRKPALDFDATMRWNKCHRADRVVYMSRDPRDTIVSLYHQVTGRFRDFFHFEGGLAEFVRDPYFGAQNLARFQRMWRSAVDAGLAVHVRYEDAHRDFPSVLRRVLDAFGIERTEDAIRGAADQAALENMRKVEAGGEFHEPWLRKRNDAPKVRRGVVGGFRDELDPAEQKWLEECFAGLIDDSSVD